MAMKMVSSTEAQNNFGRVLDDITQKGTRYVVLRRGQPQVIMLDIADLAAILDGQYQRDGLYSVLQEMQPIYDIGTTVNE